MDVYYNCKNLCDHNQCISVSICCSPNIFQCIVCEDEFTKLKINYLLVFSFIIISIRLLLLLLLLQHKAISFHYNVNALNVTLFVKLQLTEE